MHRAQEATLDALKSKTISTGQKELEEQWLTVEECGGHPKKDYNNLK